MSQCCPHNFLPWLSFRQGHEWGEEWGVHPNGTTWRSKMLKKAPLSMIIIIKTFYIILHHFTSLRLKSILQRHVALQDAQEGSFVVIAIISVVIVIVIKRRSRETLRKAPLFVNIYPSWLYFGYKRSYLSS